MANVQQKPVPLPDFTSSAVVAYWPLDLKETAEEAMSFRPKEETSIDTLESDPTDLLETLFGYHPRVEVPLRDICPAGQYRGEQSLPYSRRS